MNTNGSFGGWLKQRRKALDLTQVELADQVGCTVTLIRKIEADIRRPSKQIAACMFDILALSDDERPSFMNFARRLLPLPISPPDDLITPQTPIHLPTHTTAFLGREHELAQIAERLTDSNCHLLTLIGLGVGSLSLKILSITDVFYRPQTRRCGRGLSGLNLLTKIA